MPPLTEVLHSALFLAIVVTAWTFDVSFPIIVAFVVLLYRLQPHVRALQQARSQMQGWSGSLEQVRWLLDASDKPQPPAGDLPAPRLNREIKFDKVSFRYPGSNARPVVLRSASFEIGHGRSTALIGRSGAGKTTIVNLLCRFVEPDEGEILIDGLPLSRIDPSGDHFWSGGNSTWLGCAPSISALSIVKSKIERIYRASTIACDVVQEPRAPVGSPLK
ncbi:ABC-type multidrug transport system fused ATPase/permease subunit [Rhizobium sp. BK609]|nr:ABC-type multidrug transport system fused ATPase/permease subunit [Rhizobium sp. BK098]MBB3615050.1 ABC-type multidrug transport system fused ATPase/permease subunit [Rhizobium sp. BK609]MBB3680710.1 ABC-type multidrug transport system fused ATPase/permease subunit [Rhizobium sp. BK612]